MDFVVMIKIQNFMPENALLKTSANIVMIYGVVMIGLFLTSRLTVKKVKSIHWNSALRNVKKRPTVLISCTSMRKGTQVGTTDVHYSVNAILKPKRMMDVMDFVVMIKIQNFMPENALLKTSANMVMIYGVVMIGLFLTSRLTVKKVKSIHWNSALRNAKKR